MPIALSYVVTLVVFLVIDALWLGTMSEKIYRPLLGDILMDGFRKGPAISFYLIYAAGILIFAVVPALKEGSWNTALLWGALFGFFAYATYDLTNYATLRNWGLTITLIDLAWGTFVTAIGATIAYFVASWLLRSFNMSL
ncbi:MAG: hypothetical protein B7Z15_08260 [Rhizobiales bacterium 32-66-8]|nr:MAG: hypothetical protein B7Z15_08260 [Rhizobiales bacterium 32-66-8]